MSAMCPSIHNAVENQLDFLIGDDELVHHSMFRQGKLTIDNNRRNKYDRIVNG